MSATYDEYRYLWPPRPEGKIPLDMIAFYERRGWVAQVKKNGTLTVIFVRGPEVIFKTRHNAEHKLWTPQAEHFALFQRQPTGSGGVRFPVLDLPEKWSVYVAELLHSKTPHIKNHLYLFDVLVKGGEDLVGATFNERQAILRSLFPAEGGGRLGARPVRGSNGLLSVATNYFDGFRAVMAGLGAEDEGIVLKNPNAPLRACLTPDANAGWQVKCRKPHKNYSF